MHTVAVCGYLSWGKTGKGHRDFTWLQISPREVRLRLKSIRGGDTEAETERERETTGEITLITHTVHLAASWNHTLFLHSPPSITVSTDTRHEEACFLYSSFHVFCTAVIYHYVPSILAPEIKRCMSIKHWGALYISHARSSFCTVVRSNSFLLVWLCEDSHTPSTERTKVSDSDTAVIT